MRVAPAVARLRAPMQSQQSAGPETQGHLFLVQRPTPNILRIPGRFFTSPDGRRRFVVQDGVYPWPRTYVLPATDHDLFVDFKDAQNYAIERLRREERNLLAALERVRVQIEVEMTRTAASVPEAKESDELR